MELDTLEKVLPIICISAIVLIIAYFIIRAKGNKGGLQYFENKMRSQGFTKRIITYDFFHGGYRAFAAPNSFVGVWFNYPKKLAAFRILKGSGYKIWQIVVAICLFPFGLLALMVKNNRWYGHVVPFHSIQSAEIIGSEYSVFRGHGIEIGPISTLRGKVKTIPQELQVRISTGDMQKGFQTYILMLHKRGYGTWYDMDSVEYRCIKDCAQSIVDEIANIIRHTE